MANNSGKVRFLENNLILITSHLDKELTKTVDWEYEI
jgi:hypothetical protein